MKRPTLELPAWAGPPPGLDLLLPDGSVVWLGEGARDRWLEPLRRALGPRVWAPAMSTVSVPRPADERNPWVFPPDAFPPLRWGEIERDVRSLGELPDRPAVVAGVVIDGALAGLGSQEARTLLQQAAALLPTDAPWLLVERNGAHAPEVLRNLLRPDDARGEGRGTVRSAPELRRLVEVEGFGITEAWSLPQPGRRARLLAAAGSSAWLVLRGRRV